MRLASTLQEPQRVFICLLLAREGFRSDIFS